MTFQMAKSLSSEVGQMVKAESNILTVVIIKLNVIALNGCLVDVGDTLKGSFPTIISICIMVMQKYFFPCNYAGFIL